MSNSLAGTALSKCKRGVDCRLGLALLFRLSMSGVLYHPHQVDTVPGLRTGIMNCHLLGAEQRSGISLFFFFFVFPAQLSFSTVIRAQGLLLRHSCHVSVKVPLILINGILILPST